MKCCSPAESPNDLYINPSQPVGLEEETASLAALQAQSADASLPLSKLARVRRTATFSV